MNSIEKAEDHYHRAMGVARELGMPPLLGHCHLGLGLLFSRAGQLHDSEQHLTRAAAMFGEMGMRLPSRWGADHPGADARPV